MPALGSSSSQIEADIRRIREHRWKGDVDPAFAQLVTGKSVAVVGPARTLIGTKQGRRIDSHDLIVRFNDTIDVFPAKPALADDIGTRLDILYSNQVILRGWLGRESGVWGQLVDSFNRVAVKYLVCTNNSLNFTTSGDPRPDCDPQDARIIADLVPALHRRGSAARVRVVEAASGLLEHWLQGNWGRTGFVAILDLLSFHVGRLFITGMTFYHGGGHLLAPKSRELHPLKNRDGTWAQSPSGRGHDSYLELEVMKLLARGFGGVVETDEVLTALLSA